MGRRRRKSHWIRLLLPAAGALLLAGSALGTPPRASTTIAAFFPSLVASAPRPAPDKTAPRQAPRPRPQDAPATFRVAAEHRERPAPPSTSCGKHFLAPFAGPLQLRSAYRSGGGPVNFCPTWSTFGPVRGGHRNHWGIDIASPTGTSIRAATDGIVTYAREANGYGLFARLRFSAPLRNKQGACGSHEDIEIIYAHLIDDGKTNTATRSVRAGEVIGRVGCTGNARGMCSPSPESHLHVTVQKSGNHAKIDPGPFLGWNIHLPSERPADWGTCGKK